MQVTLATAADAAEMAAVKVVGWRTTYAAWVPDVVLAPFLDPHAQAAALAAELREAPNFALVAREGGRMLGFATCRLAGSDEPLLDSLHVLPEARGRGVGSALLDRLARELCSRRGAVALGVHVVEENTRTRALYERLGARYVGTEPAAWAPSVREAVYRWDDLAALKVGPTAAG